MTGEISPQDNEERQSRDSKNGWKKTFVELHLATCFHSQRGKRLVKGFWLKVNSGWKKNTGNGVDEM